MLAGHTPVLKWPTCNQQARAEMRCWSVPTSTDSKPVDVEGVSLTWKESKIWNHHAVRSGNEYGLLMMVQTQIRNEHKTYRNHVAYLKMPALHFTRAYALPLYGMPRPVFGIKAEVRAKKRLALDKASVQKEHSSR